EKPVYRWNSGSRAGSNSAGVTGLEPATYGFGDRCASNCATPLRPRSPVSSGHLTGSGHPAPTGYRSAGQGRVDGRGGVDVAGHQGGQAGADRVRGRAGGDGEWVGDPVDGQGV